MTPFFPASDPKKSVPETEKEILKLWQARNVFQRSVSSRSSSKPYRFFDGPPFATGSPHYGHILAGAIKDAIPRYWTMKGYRVDRKWGWDCHGVPVEFQVEKENNIGGKPGIEKIGVGKFNEMCRSIVLRCADEWRDSVARMGRAVDFENDYKTMDPEFMESVWWVFQTLWDKGLIYEGDKVIPYSPKLGSPLSNFEAGLNYKDIDDPAVTIKFREIFSSPSIRHFKKPVIVARLIFQNEKGEILIGKQKYLTRMYQQIPGGKWDEGETLIETIQRELREEIGRESDVILQDEVYISDVGGYINVCFVAQEKAPEVKLNEPDVIFDWQFCAPEKLQKLFHKAEWGGGIVELLEKFFAKKSDTTTSEVENYVENYLAKTHRYSIGSEIDVETADQGVAILQKDNNYFIMPTTLFGSADRWTDQDFKIINADQGLKKKEVARIEFDDDVPENFREIFSFPTLDKPTYFLAWTTTPWTLPSNCALGFGRDTDYALVEQEDAYYWLASAQVGNHFGEEAKVIATRPGRNFRGISYEPLFDFFTKDSETPRFIGLTDEGNYVSTAEGTGIVHFAPAFGAEDADLCDKFGVFGVNPINDDGYFESPETKPLNGKYFREDPEVDGSKENNANTWVIEELKRTQKLFKREQIRHSYPHCWRTDCALQYRTVKTWFVSVSKIKSQILAQNQNINWIPEHLKGGRFGKILESAPDWAISRNRYWGCPLPVWRGEKTGKIIVIGSREALEKRTGKKVNDLHKHFVDDLTFEENGEKFSRIPEVLDCWFESGSMPYASMHHPFRQNNITHNQYFIARHGESEQNVAGVYSTSDYELHGLTSKGKSHIEKIAEVQKESNIDLIITSPFRRAKETAEIFAKFLNVPVEVDERLRELDMGDLDGQPDRDFTQHYGSKDKIGGGESYIDAFQRSKKVILDCETKHQGKRILCVTHGGVVGALQRWADGRDLVWDGPGEIPSYGKVQKLIFQPQDSQDFMPANFIAEGLDQTRGWFYTLHVLGCGLFGRNIFENVITNGIVLAEDGQKMSKSKKNYPDPNLIFDQYGADAMRFYLLSSPVVHGENFRFAEHGVSEVLKSVILPLRSAYHFFSTYANIDSWQPTRVIFMRHGEAENNISKIHATHSDDQHPLTKKGIEQVKKSAKNLPELDVIFSSPLQRTRETAEIIRSEKNISEVLIDPRLVEAKVVSELEGKSWEENPLRRGKDIESASDIIDRVRDFITEMATKYRGKTICCTSHGDPCRAFIRLVSDQNADDIFEQMPDNADIFSLIFMDKTKDNELDQWLISELQELVKNFREKMDNYLLDDACRLIPPFVDRLNNWYLRRSRRRFWASGLSEDKKQGYETLHHVLMSVSRLLAPIMPFFSDWLYQSLGGTDSVHIDFMPSFDATYYQPQKNTTINLMRDIVSLSAGIRANAKIKLRQPLGELRFSVDSSVASLISDQEKQIIAEEANVKKVTLLTDTEMKKFAKKIVRVDAKAVGPRLGKKVQELIVAGKNGDFVDTDEGNIEICGETLSSNEFAYGFVCEEGVQAEASAQSVVVLDTAITEDLRQEGIMREIIRMIQELRKTEGFEVSDRIVLSFSTESADIQQVLENFREKISSECLIENWKDVADKKSAKNFEIEGAGVFLILEKSSH